MGKTRLSVVGLMLAVPSAAQAAMAIAPAQLGPLLVASAQISDPAYKPAATVASTSQTATSGSAFAQVMHDEPADSGVKVPGLSNAVGLANFGGLHVYAQSGTDPFNIGYNDVTATAAFFDPVTISALRSGPRRAARVDFSFDIYAAVLGGTFDRLLGFAPSRAELQWDVGLYNGTDRIAGTTGEADYDKFSPGYIAVPAQGSTGSSTGLQGFSALAGAVLNRPLSLVATLTCTAHNGAICNSSRSLEWGGMSYRDSDDTDLGPLSAISASGMDYAQPNAAFLAAVPEPVNWLSMIVGFGWVGAIMRRRHAVTAAA